MNSSRTIHGRRLRLRVRCGATFFLLAAATFLEGQESDPPPRDRGFLGLYTAEIPEAEFGLRVERIIPYSAATTLGFEIGDVVLTLNDVLLSKPDDLRRELGGSGEGSTVRFLVRRDGEKMKLEGKLGGYKKTMELFQNHLRKSVYGDTLAPPPAIVWWNPKEESWGKSPQPLPAANGRTRLIFSFDDCRYCQEQKYGKFSLLARQLGEKTPIDVVGIYFKNGTDRSASQETAAKMLKALPAAFPVGVSYYPDGESADPVAHALLHYHGVAIEDPAGKVKYLQIFGAFGEEFASAYQKTLSEALGAGAAQPK